jgi:hypothetical protein
MPERKETNIKITDRRMFNADGSLRESEGSPTGRAESPSGPQESEKAQPATEAKAEVAAPSEQGKVVSFPGEAARERGAAAASGSRPEPAAERKSAPRAPGAGEEAYNQASSKQPTDLPEATFLSLVHMLAVEAAMSLGLVENPGQAQPAVDLDSARHLIDLLSILQTKTQGNLSPEEEKLLENVLADLRMQFVAHTGRR